MKNINFTKKLLILPLILASVLVSNVIYAQTLADSTVQITQRMFPNNSNTLYTIPEYPGIVNKNKANGKKDIQDNVKALNYNGTPISIDLFFSGLSPVGNTDYTLTLPSPLVASKQQNQSNIVIDGQNPDQISIKDTQLVTSKDYGRSGTETKECPSDTCSATFTIPLQSIADLNKNIKNSVVDSSGKFLSTDPKLTAINPADYSKYYVFVEYCFANKVVYDYIDTSTNTTKPAYNYGGRNVIGSSTYEKYGVFPTFLNMPQQFQCVNPQPQGTSFSSSAFASGSTPTTVGGIGEFYHTNIYGSINCDLSANPLVSSDLFGNKTIGVQTALGCLPGNINGVAAVLLRIAIGISGVILFILILLNALNIINGGSNPQKLKEYVGNITKGVVAILIIIFSVFILNLVGVKIIPLGELGGSNIEQIVGQ